MKVLFAQNIDGRFQKVGVYHVRKDGTVSLPSKFNGQIEGRFIRDGARHLAEESGVNWIEFQFGSSPTYRVSMA